MTDYANPDALVSTDWLEQHLDDPDVSVIEVDEDTTAYEKGHIRGAVGWNWNTDLHTSVGSRVPDFVKLADAYGCAGFRCERPEDVDDTIRAAMAVNDRPVVVDFVVHRALELLRDRFRTSRHVEHQKIAPLRQVVRERQLLDQ